MRGRSRETERDPVDRGTVGGGESPVKVRRVGSCRTDTLLVMVLVSDLSRVSSPETKRFVYGQRRRRKCSFPFEGVYTPVHLFRALGRSASAVSA